MTAAVTASLAVGQTHELAIDPISRTTLALFAGASGDTNPMHIDTDVARSAGLDDVFAHGMLSMAFLGRLLTDLAPIDQVRRFKVRFAAITPLHARPVCTAVIESVTPDGNEDVVVLALSVTLADGTVTLLGEATLRRPATRL